MGKSMIPRRQQSVVDHPQNRESLMHILGYLFSGDRRNELAIKCDWNESENPAPRSPCGILCDASGSMAGEPIFLLNEGLGNFGKFVREDSLAARCTDIAVIRIGGCPKLIVPFTPAECFFPPELEAAGDTPLAEGILSAIAVTEDRICQIEKFDLDMHRPVIVVISDGQANPSGNTQKAIDEVRRVEKNKSISIHGVGVNSTASRALQKFMVRPVVTLAEWNFISLFRTVSQHIINASRTMPGNDTDFDWSDADWAE